MVSKFILTVIADDQADEVEATLREAAEALNARLTRGDFEPASDHADTGYYRKLRSRTLRKQGALS